jgi:hypothetical protein
MLSAEGAVLVHLQAVWIVLLVFESVIVALLAFAASECDFDSHIGTSLFRLPPCRKLENRRTTKKPFSEQVESL